MPKPYRAAISVIVPTLNEEKLITQFLSQFTPELKTMFSIELIISDGGSTDRTLEVVEPLLSESDKIVRHFKPTRQTIAEGRNRGADAASGEILIFFNADTLIGCNGQSVLDFFTAVLETFKRYPHLHALITPVRVFPDDERPSDVAFHGFINWLYFFCITLNIVGVGRGECHIVRRRAFDAEQGYNERMAAGEDFDLFRRIGAARIKFLSRLCVYESPRRYRKYGYGAIFRAWGSNALWVVFRGKSRSSEWTEVR